MRVRGQRCQSRKGCLRHVEDISRIVTGSEMIGTYIYFSIR